MKSPAFRDEHFGASLIEVTKQTEWVAKLDQFTPNVFFFSEYLKARFAL